MKKNITLLSSLVVGAVAVTGLATTTLAAEDATSNATIKAIAGSDPVAPVDPTDPTDETKPGPTDPDDGNNVHQKGNLQINYLSNLNFGDDIAITGRTVTANVKNETPRFFQVSDLRGTSGGWALNVKLGDFMPTSTKVTDKKITGAKITFAGGEAKTSSTDVETADYAILPKNGGEVNGEKQDSLVLKAGGEQNTMMKADKGTGRGTWLATYTAKSGASDNENIVFEAPTNSISADTGYQATLTWQLVDGAK